MRLTSRSLALTLAFACAAAFALAAPAAAQVPVAPVEPLVAASLAPAATAPPAATFAALTFDDQQRAYRRGAGRTGSAGARVFGLLDLEHMTASQSFDAVVGTSTLFGFGGGVDITGIADGFFIRLALSEMSKSGTRTAGSQLSNGIAVDVKMIPIDLAAGWRFNHVVAGNGITPFVGGGALLLRYSETTPSGNTDDNVRTFFTGYVVFGGIDLRVSPVLTIAPEIDYRGVPNAIGKGGISQDFNETDLGGLTFRISVGARFGGSR